MQSNLKISVFQTKQRLASYFKLHMQSTYDPHQSIKTDYFPTTLS